MSLPAPIPRHGMDSASVAGLHQPQSERQAPHSRWSEAERPAFTWICLGCGFHHMNDTSPEKCPRCTGVNILSGFGHAD